jgi:hypothetical protein
LSCKAAFSEMEKGIIFAFVYSISSIGQQPCLVLKKNFILFVVDFYVAQYSTNRISSMY